MLDLQGNVRSVAGRMDKNGYAILLRIRTSFVYLLGYKIVIRNLERWLYEVECHTAAHNSTYISCEACYTASKWC